MGFFAGLVGALASHVWTYVKSILVYRRVSFPVTASVLQYSHFLILTRHLQIIFSFTYNKLCNKMLSEVMCATFRPGSCQPPLHGSARLSPFIHWMDRILRASVNNLPPWAWEHSGWALKFCDPGNFVLHSWGNWDI